MLSLPAPYATLSAEGFAAAGVHLLSMLGCVDTLCFGAETPDPELLHRTAQTLRRPEFQREMRHAPVSYTHLDVYKRQTLAYAVASSVRRV